MSRDIVWIGPCPPEEDPVQVGEEDYMQRSREECQRYIDLLRKKFGDEPPGARLCTKVEEHDLGTYLEVVCKFDSDVPEAVAYAFRCEGEGPLTWNG